MLCDKELRLSELEKENKGLKEIMHYKADKGKYNNTDEGHREDNHGNADRREIVNKENVSNENRMDPRLRKNNYNNFFHEDKNEGFMSQYMDHGQKKRRPNYN